MVFFFFPTYLQIRGTVDCTSFNMASGNCLSTQWKLSGCHLESSHVLDCLTNSCFANANKFQHTVRLSHIPWVCIHICLKITSDTEYSHIRVWQHGRSSPHQYWTALLLCHHQKTASLLACVFAFGASIQQCRNCCGFSCSVLCERFKWMLLLQMRCLINRQKNLSCLLHIFLHWWYGTTAVVGLGEVMATDLWNWKFKGMALTSWLCIR